MVDDRTALMSAKALSSGYEVLWYTIDRVLGQGGFGITYLAHDRNLDRAVAIKEYLPTSFAFRHQDYSVKPITGDHREHFVWGLGSFLKEAQTLARFSHPNIVRVHSVFEENNTAYMVMEYEHGQNLAATYKERGSLDQAFFEQVFFPIFDGLSEIHKFEFIHRDIKPANIYIREDGTPVLIDFGSARQTTQQQTSEMTTLVSQGYTPLEQYSANYGDQGPWTDIYALAATIYEGVVGRKPDESLSRSACLMRSKPDVLVPLNARDFPGFSQRFLNAVLVGLKLEPESRPQSLEEWYRIFEQGDDRFQSPPESSGFTELESDRTRIRPGGRALESTAESFDSFTEFASDSQTSSHDDSRRFAESSVRTTQSAAAMDATQTAIDAPFEHEYPLSRGSNENPTNNEHSQRFQPDTDFRTDEHSLSFDEDEPHDDSQVGSGLTSRRRRESVQRNRKKRKTRSGWVAAAVVSSLLFAVSGAYYLYRGDVATSGISKAALDKMPRPSGLIETVLPEERVLAQLDDMVKLAPLLAQALQLNAEDPILLDTIRSTEASLLTIAKQWNADKYTEIANRISAVSNALPASVHDQSRIQRIVSTSSQVSGHSQVLALLDDKRYLVPAGDSVLDWITALSDEDYRKLKSTTQWAQMMSEFSGDALARLARSEFDDVARLTEVALTLDAEEPGFKALRSFLSGS